MTRRVVARSLDRGALEGLLICLATLMLVPGGAEAGINVSLTAASIRKAELTTDGQAGSEVWTFEACVNAGGVAPGQHRIALPPNFSPTFALQSLGGDDYCYVQTNPSRSSLDGEFQTGDYKFLLTPQGGSTPLEYVVGYSPTIPVNGAVIEAPSSNSSLLQDRDIDVFYKFGTAGPCGNCAGFVTAVLSQNLELHEGLTAPDVFQTKIPNSILMNQVEHLISVSAYSGTPDGMSMQNGSTFSVETLYERGDLAASVLTVNRTLDLKSVTISKGTSRANGTILSMSPYFFTACVVATDISGPSLDTPGGDQLQLDLISGSTEEYCGTETFGDRAALDAKYPSDDPNPYLFHIIQPNAQLPFYYVWADATPKASIAYVRPRNDEVVASNRNLRVRWDLNKGTGCSAPGDCGDSIEALLLNNNRDMVLAASPILPITDKVTFFSSTALGTGDTDRIETSTFTGMMEEQQTDGVTDAYLRTHANLDVNEITINVPEPALALLQLAAVASVLACRARRRDRVASD